MRIKKILVSFGEQQETSVRLETQDEKCGGEGNDYYNAEGGRPNK